MGLGTWSRNAKPTTFFVSSSGPRCNTKRFYFRECERRRNNLNRREIKIGAKFSSKHSGSVSRDMFSGLVKQERMKGKLCVIAKSAFESHRLQKAAGRESGAGSLGDWGFLIGRRLGNCARQNGARRGDLVRQHASVSTGRGWNDDGIGRRGYETESNSKLRPTFRDHRDVLQSIQEKSAEELKKHNRASRSRAKMKFQQKMRQTNHMKMVQEAGSPLGVRIDDGLVSKALASGSNQQRDVVEASKVDSTTGSLQHVFVPSTKRSGSSSMSAARSTRDQRGKQREVPSAQLFNSINSISNGSSNGADYDSEDFDSMVDESTVRQIYQNKPPKDVHVVETLEEAQRIVSLLMDPSMEERTYGCDTEVMDIDITRESPCCHGIITCFSLYCGPDMHFGSEPAHEGDVKKNMIWVDTWLNGEESKKDEAKAILETFRVFFESERHKKVWHNYSFDRHVIERMGIVCGGFYGDTMHMARLWDSSRTGRGGYSLEALSAEEQLMGPMDHADARGKISMKKIFGRRNIKKDGTEGKLIILPPIEELQASEETRWDWINYSAYDAKATWDLHEALVLQLMDIHATPDRDVFRAYEESGVKIRSLWDIYCHVWRPFGALLTDLEAFGVAVDVNHLAEAEKQATQEEAKSRTIFREWAASKVPDAQYMNVGSSSQVVQLFFGGAKNRNKEKPGVPLSRTFKVPNVLPAEDGKKPKKNMDIILHNVWSKDQPTRLQPEIYTPAGLPGCSTLVLKDLAGKPGRARKALAKLTKEKQSGEEDGIESVRLDFDDIVDTWSTDDAEISKIQQERTLAKKEESPEFLEALAKEQGYGRLFSQFGNREEGLRACAAVDSLIDASAIDTLLSNFIIPLQSDAISKPDTNGVRRVHCSLNINTETGRLSARRPNLQNQPALEKDRYRVRQAFTADRTAGNTLIVADYGQLELRILAHMANCTSMIQAFELGGDFHSRTALGMYDHIKRAIDAGDCLLEWEGRTEPPVPLLKDMFSSERRKAKILNFSIAYGKTAHGLSKDWNVTLKEAEETVERWYAERAEVRTWQQEQHALALSEGYVCTILGRRRQLPGAKSKNKALRSHSLRAAINTPIQGSAADVATAAMLRINSNEKLKDLGWKLLLQVHDEVILEGPKESAPEAQSIVLSCMRSPFGEVDYDPLRVELSVDSKYADTCEGVKEALSSVVADYDEQHKMREILVRLHRELLEEDETVEGESVSGEFVQGVSWVRAVQFAEGEISIDDLTKTELAALTDAMQSNTQLLEGDGIVEAWKPWWESTDVSKIVLGARGTAVVESEEDGGAWESSNIPCAPKVALVPLSSLTSRAPSPQMPLHLADLIYWYCLIMRLYNGDYSSDNSTVVCLFLCCSLVLQEQQAVLKKCETVHDLVTKILEVSCNEANAVFGKIPSGLAIGVLLDVVHLVRLGRTAIVLALTDISRIFERGKLDDIFRDKKDSRLLFKNSAKSKLANARRKMVFFLSWANEFATDTMAATLSSAVEFEYHRQKQMIPETDKIVILQNE